jgi:hypothetical protein
MAPDRPGFEDTPFLPNSEYRVHDPDRPYPSTVTPAGPIIQSPPSDAIVLYDGQDLSRWEATDGSEPDWTVTDGTVRVVPDSGDIRTTEPLGDCQLHIEWATPTDPCDAEYPGNSGVFLADRYEIQILDCATTNIYADGWVGAVYGQHPPRVNACLAPGTWQSFDIVWRRPRFDGNGLESPAQVTVLHNGIVIQECTEPFGPTTYRDYCEYEPHGPAPLRLQDHGFPVQFRNIWHRTL